MNSNTLGRYEHPFFISSMSQPTFRSRVREPLGVANCWRDNSDNAREKRRENLVSLRPSARGTLTRAPRVWARLRVASFRAMEPPAVPRAVERLSAATLRNSSSGATSISTEAVFFGDPRPSLAAALRRTTEAWGFSYAVFWREEDDFARCVFHAADCVEKEEAATLRQVRFHPGRGAVGRAMRDRRGFDLCANLADMDETTFAKQELVAERGTRNVVCCRVRGGVLELGTAGDLCPVHISGACPCASITPVAPRRASFEASLNNDNEHRRSPLRVGSSNERAWREIEARAREGASAPPGSRTSTWCRAMLATVAHKGRRRPRAEVSHRKRRKGAVPRTGIEASSFWATRASSLIHAPGESGHARVEEECVGIPTSGVRSSFLLLMLPS